MKRILLLVFSIFMASFQAKATVYLHCPPDQDLGCNPKHIPKPKPNDLLYTTDCRKAKVKHVSDVVVTQDCEHILTRTYEATDKCGDTDQCVQTIRWTIDTEPPVIEGCGSIFTLPCNAKANNLVPPANPVLLQVTDNCGVASVVLLNLQKVTVGCDVISTRRYLATDHCGNTTECIIRYRWTEDNIPPQIIQCPPSINLGCNPTEAQLSPQNGLNQIVFFDNCGTANVIIGESAETVLGCLVTLVHQYIIADGCGNASTCTQTIHYTRDTEAPKIVFCPPDVDLGCSNTSAFFIPDPNPGAVIATDNCGIADIDVIVGDRIVDGCNYRVTYTYVVKDHCGNTTSCQQTLKWTDDKIPPVMTCFDLDLGCNPESLPEPAPAQVLVNDNCCIESVKHFADSDITVFGCKYSMIRYYIATDCCGNTSTCGQSIKWKVDNIPPVFTQCPPDLDLGCNPDLGDLTSNGLNLVKAEDNCGEVTISFGGLETFISGCKTLHVYTYIATDECGNTSSCQRQVTYVKDETPPVITQCPPDREMGCPGPNGIVIPDPDLDLLKYEDNCGNVTVEVLDGGDIVVFGCQARYVRGFMVTDACGNTAICQQNLVWTWDFTPPTMLCVDLDLGCNPESIPEPAPAQVIVNDNCCIESVKHFADSDITVVGCDYSMIRYYIATDCCGNTSTCGQSIRWKVDQEAPSVENCDEVIDLGCDQVPETVLIARCLGAIVATDNCGDPSIQFAGNETTIEGCAKYIVLKFIISDECGNSITCKKTFKMVNDEAPVITKCPADQYLGCFQQGNFEIPAPNPQDLEVDSDCPYQVTVLNGIDIVVFGCTATYVRAYVVTTPCGKADTCTQTFTWTVDNIPPVIKLCGEGKHFGCVTTKPEIPALDPASILVEDNCGIDKIEYSDQLSNVDCFYTLTRLVTVTDKCGNIDRCEIVYKWVLTEKEVIDIPFPEDVVVLCGEIPEAPDYTSTNECGLMYPVLVNEVIVGDCSDGNCTIHRTWRKTNCFGLEFLQVQTITLKCELTGGRSLPDVDPTKSANSASFELKAYPNPGIETVNLDWKARKDQNYLIEMFDNNGKLILSKKVVGQTGQQTEQLNAGHADPGMYMIRLSTNDYQQVVKWIKTN
ncbi:MAG: T9SS type A sorting domain-containing protein [Saprospiraceae bacterium]|nr:T9SS type A sorting domain-containing protein [Saprospiraceae bacterium]